MLPGLRATVVSDSQARRPRPPASARRPRPSRPRSTRSRRCWSTCRWPTSTGPSTTSCLPRWPTRPCPGARVKVRFAGQDVDAFVVARAAASDHPGTAGAAAPRGERRAGARPRDRRAERRRRRAVRRQPRADVLRLAVPPRHATTEPRAVAAGATPARARPGRGPAAWADHEHGRRLPRATWPQGGAPRAVWSAAPGTDWPRLVAHAVAAAVPRGRGRAGLRARPPRRRPGVGARSTAVLGAGTHVALTADDGPAPRATDASCAVSRGARPGRRRHPLRVVRPGARPRPGRDLGRRRRPARRAARAVPPHPRDAPAARRAAGHRRPGRRLRAHRRGAVPAAHRLGPRDRAAPASWSGRDRDPRRRRADRARERDPHAAGARMPAEVHRRSGRRSSTVRSSCRPRGWATRRPWPASAAASRPGAAPAPARWRCRRRPRPPACRWCGDRAAGVGVRGVRPPRPAGPGRRRRRTAEELGRAFPAVRVRSSSGDRVLADGPGRPAGDRGRHARGGAGGRRRLRRRRPARHLADPGPRPTCAPPRRRCGGGPTPSALVRDRRPGRGRRRPRPPRAAGPGPLGPGRLRRARDRRAARRRTCRRRPGWRPSPASPGPVDDALTLLAAPAARRGARPGAGRGGVAGDRAGAARRGRRPVARRSCEVQRVRSARKLDAVRIQVDPTALG